MRRDALQEALERGVPQPTGRRVSRNGREWLLHTRQVASEPARVWEALTRVDRLEQWIGTWRRLPDATLEFRFTFEGDDLLPAVYRLAAFAEGRSFTVSLSEPGANDPSEVQVEVATAADGAEQRGSVLTLIHAVENVALAPHLAAGCEYYLDRLVSLLERRRAQGPGGPAGVDFDEYFLAHAPYYRRLFPLR
jgi:uncharacterized protein YndB with AHSA1/START domain